ncbi:hypothetical protein BDZ94DRAFT_786460 [Collybia nuda]|uniref:Uncharacterized protein n=1 Tax=Collybia nuda TaxID=64659 RepID=A0A9P6CJ70_9AGAR|nr:hypothetical protein BDZ94DRAFT_786460 [Collybia nuda]
MFLDICGTQFVVSFCLALWGSGWGPLGPWLDDVHRFLCKGKVWKVYISSFSYSNSLKISVKSRVPQQEPQSTYNHGKHELTGHNQIQVVEMGICTTINFISSPNKLRSRGPGSGF